MICRKCKTQDSLPERRLCQGCISSQQERYKQQQKGHYQRQKQKRLAANLCTTCGKKPPSKGFRQCQNCRDKHATEQALIRQKRAAANLCNRCGKKPAPPGTLCKSCRAIVNKQVIANRKARHALLKDQGLCVECKQPNNNPEFSTCPVCLAKRRDKDARKRLTKPQYTALVRDNFTCQLCSRKKSLQVHHIDGNGTGRPEPNDDLSNLITLCNYCHHAITVLRGCGKRELAVNLILALDG